MNNNWDLVRILTEQIRDLRLAANQIERTLEQHLEERERLVEGNQERGPPTDPLVQDRDENNIHIGDQIIFLTRVLYNSTTGPDYKVSNTSSRVTARDDYRRSISRSHNNVRIVNLRPRWAPTTIKQCPLLKQAQPNQDLRTLANAGHQRQLHPHLIYQTMKESAAT